MLRRSVSVEQIVAVLKQAEFGVPVAKVIRKVGISDADLLSMEEAVRRVKTDQACQQKQLDRRTAG